MHGNSSAARLLAIVENGKKISQQENCRNAWASIFKCPPSDHATLMKRLGMAMSLPGEIVEQIRRDFPRQYERNDYAHFLNTFMQAFSHNLLDQPWATFIRKIDGPAVTYLSSTTDLFEMKGEADVMSDEDLIEIGNSVQELIETTLATDWPADLKRFVVGQLRAVASAIDEYHISGISPILDTIAATLGHACLREDYRKTLKTQSGMSFAKALASIANLVTVASGIPQLAQAGPFLLDFFGD